MSQPSLFYTAPPRLRWQAVERPLPAGLQLQTQRQATVTRQYLDTFDWRLFRAGTVLEVLCEHGRRLLRWRTLSTGEIVFERPVERVPRMAADLGTGERARRIARRIGIRALLPVAESRGRLASARVLDNSSKTVMRLELWTPTGAGRKTNGIRLEPLLQLLPVRGYAKPLKHMRELLEGELGLERTPSDPLLVLTANSERPPADYSNSHSLRLEATMPTIAACKAILRELLAVMQENEAGVRSDADTEFLHDFRVAVRRTRSLLSQVKGIFPTRSLARFRRDFAWLQEVTGPVRDLDVYLLDFDELRSALPDSLRSDLEPLRDYIRHRRMEAFEALVRALKSARYRKLVDEWGQVLEREDPRRSSLPNATRPVVDVAGERIWRMYKRSLAEGNAIDASSPAEDLHELRKTCKKLRYLLEFFRTLFAPKPVEQLIKRLKGLQDNLGTFQDVEVQRESLGELKQAMADDGVLNPRTALAIDLLRDDLLRRHQVLRDAFAEHFSDYATRSHRGRLKALFAPSKRSREAA